MCFYLFELSLESDMWVMEMDVKLSLYYCREFIYIFMYFYDYAKTQTDTKFSDVTSPSEIILQNKYVSSDTK